MKNIGTAPRQQKEKPHPESRQEIQSIGSATVSGVFSWLSNDPIDIRGGLNQYVFVGNNPVNKVDPHGLCWKWGDGGWTIVGTIAGIAGGSLIVAATSPAWITVGAVTAIGGTILVAIDTYVGWNNAQNIPQKTIDKWKQPGPSGTPTWGGYLQDSDGDGVQDCIDDTPFPPATSQSNGVCRP